MVNEPSFAFVAYGRHTHIFPSLEKHLAHHGEIHGGLDGRASCGPDANYSRGPIVLAEGCAITVELLVYALNQFLVRRDVHIISITAGQHIHSQWIVQVLYQAQVWNTLLTKGAARVNA